MSENEKPLIKRQKLEKGTYNIVLSKCFNEDPLIIEIGIDEAGRGPMFGRVYAGAVVLHKDDSFN